MTEKKTFKIGGPCGMGLWHNHLFRAWEVSGVQPDLEDGINRFDPFEWDMEVTFTKKVKPLEAGDEIITERNIRGTIRAIHGHYCWVEYPAGGLGTYALNETRRV